MPTATISKPTKPASTKPLKAVEPKQEFVTTEQFNQVTDVLSKLVDAVTELKNKPTPTAAQSAQDTEVAKAKADQAPINPSWEEKAQEILGEYLDHCEIFYPKQGGQIFTVIIKEDMSNSPKEYMERHKSDRRSREIGNEGIAGVENWCKLVRANLKRTANK